MDGHAVRIRRDHFAYNRYALLYGAQPSYELVAPIRADTVKVDERVGENAQSGEEQLSKCPTPPRVRLSASQCQGEAPTQCWW